MRQVNGQGHLVLSELVPSYPRLVGCQGQFETSEKRILSPEPPPRTVLWCRQWLPRPRCPSSPAGPSSAWPRPPPATGPSGRAWPRPLPTHPPATEPQKPAQVKSGVARLPAGRRALKLPASHSTAGTELLYGLLHQSRRTLLLRSRGDSTVLLFLCWKEHLSSDIMASHRWLCKL